MGYVLPPDEDESAFSGEESLLMVDDPDGSFVRSTDDEDFEDRFMMGRENI